MSRKVEYRNHFGVWIDTLSKDSVPGIEARARQFLQDTLESEKKVLKMCAPEERQFSIGPPKRACNGPVRPTGNVQDTQDTQETQTTQDQQQPEGQLQDPASMATDQQQPDQQQPEEQSKDPAKTPADQERRKPLKIDHSVLLKKLTLKFLEDTGCPMPNSGSFWMYNVLELISCVREYFHRQQKLLLKAEVHEQSWAKPGDELPPMPRPPPIDERYLRW